MDSSKRSHGAVIDCHASSVFREHYTGQHTASLWFLLWLYAFESRRTKSHTLLLISAYAPDLHESHMSNHERYVPDKLIWLFVTSEWESSVVCKMSCTMKFAPLVGLKFTISTLSLFKKAAGDTCQHCESWLEQPATSCHVYNVLRGLEGCHSLLLTRSPTQQHMIASAKYCCVALHTENISQNTRRTNLPPPSFADSD